MDYYNVSAICSELEVDYDKKVVRAKYRDRWGEHILLRDFGVITHYEFEYERRETMRVNGPCEELGDFGFEEESLAIMRHDEVGLKLWFFYYQNSEMKKSSLYFANKDAFEARRKLKPLIKYLGSQGLEDRNMFIGSEHLRIAEIVSLDIPISKFNDAVSAWREKENMKHPYICLPKFGECSLDVGSQENVGYVKLVTTMRMSEEEVLPLFDYMKESMPIDVYYDDGGYGVPAPPHEINHFWPLPQGEVYMRWHGLDQFSRGNGQDYVRIELWNHTLLNECRDETYWRSEVD